MQLSFPNHRIRFRILLLRSLILLLLVAWTAGCEAELEPPPDQIVGIWSTDAPTHAGRTLEIRKDSIRFGTGEYSAPAIHSVIGVERLGLSDGEEVFLIHHRESDGAVGKVELAYRAGKKPSMTAGTAPSLRFVNRKEVWKRRGQRIPNEFA